MFCTVLVVQILGTGCLLAYTFQEKQKKPMDSGDVNGVSLRPKQTTWQEYTVVHAHSLAKIRKERELKSFSWLWSLLLCSILRSRCLFLFGGHCCWRLWAWFLVEIGFQLHPVTASYQLQMILGRLPRPVCFARMLHWKRFVCWVVE